MSPTCLCCHQPIYAGQQYIEVHVMACPEPFPRPVAHLDCLSNRNA